MSLGRGGSETSRRFQTAIFYGPPWAGRVICSRRDRTAHPWRAYDEGFFPVFQVSNCKSIIYLKVQTKHKYKIKMLKKLSENLHSVNIKYFIVFQLLFNILWTILLKFNGTQL